MQQYSQYFFIIAIVAVFYFLIIKPQQKRKKDQAELMTSLVPGAEIMTIGGLYGTIVSIDDDRIRIVVADGTEMVFAKNAIAHLVKAKASAVDDEPEADEDAGDVADDAAVNSAAKASVESKSADV